jgi:2-phosphoglycerate kinase
MARDWTVLFIGGPAAVGKTSAAKRISVITGATLLQADDVWLALQRAIDPSVEPALHAFADRAVWREPVDELLRRKRAIADIVSASLEFVLAHHLETDDRIVVEGVWITPEFAARAMYAGSSGGAGRRRAVFVLEDEATRIRDAMVDRGRGFQEWDPKDRAAMAAMQARYSRWLRAEATAHSLPIVPARPLGHLAERVLAVI